MKNLGWDIFMYPININNAWKKEDKKVFSLFESTQRKCFMKKIKVNSWKNEKINNF